MADRHRKGLTIKGGAALLIRISRRIFPSFSIASARYTSYLHTAKREGQSRLWHIDARTMGLLKHFRSRSRLSSSSHRVQTDESSSSSSSSKNGYYYQKG
ncbi:MAG: hypothetical protein INR71_05370, partial [Terriglobus roseus]|nr:hypothetical protein [Terriglobus roseus]